MGSNSTRLGTTYTPQPNGDYLLSGNKRWIGNGNKDYLIVYGGVGEGAKRPVLGGVVGVGQKGVSSVPIPHKYSFRMVQNCQIELDKVSIPQSQMLPGASSYKKGVEEVLKHSRVIVIWIAVGGCLGVMRSALAYTKSR